MKDLKIRIREKQYNVCSLWLLYMLLFVLIGTHTLQAQDNKNKLSDLTIEEKAEFQTEIQTERLHLSADQVERMYDLNLKYAKEMEQIRASGRSFTTMRKLKDMSKSKDKEVKQLLDKEQYQEYLTMKEEMMEMMKERQQSGNGN